MREHRVAVVIEDDDDLRGALAGVLRQSGFAVHAASSASEGLSRAREHNPDLVPVDIGLPDFDGFEASRRLRTFSSAYVMIVSGRADEADALMGFEAGADDYLTKPVRPRELLARIRAIFRRPSSLTYGRGEQLVGSIPAEPGEAQTVPPVEPVANLGFTHKGLSLDEDTRQVLIDGAPIALTRSQFDILLVLLEGGRKVQTKADLVRRLHNEPYSSGSFVGAGEERAVEVHLSNLRKRLGDNSRQPRWIETVHGVGYRMAL